MKTILLASKPNLIGAVASGLCLIHCIATPFIFAAQAGLFDKNTLHSYWWGSLDYIFLIISLFAVWKSSKNTSKKWIRLTLWISWSLLGIVVLNEKFSIVHLVEHVIYIPSISLIFLHIYNRRYCECKGNECCAHG